MSIYNYNNISILAPIKFYFPGKAIGGLSYTSIF